MIRIRDAVVLAATKLQTHKIRLGLAIIVSALLLTILSVGLFVSSGVFKGVESFSQEGLNSRYLTATVTYRSSLMMERNDSLAKRAEEIRGHMIAEKTARAKQLGVTYDPQSEPAVMVTPPYEGAEPILNHSSEAVDRAYKEQFEKSPVTRQILLDRIKQEGAVASYTPRTVLPVNGGTLTEMKQGKEQFSLDPPEVNYGGSDTFPPSIHTLPETLTKPFELRVPYVRDASAVPVVVPFSYAEKSLGYEKLKGDAASSEKLERIKQVQQRIAELRVHACYRNDASQEQVRSALTAAKEAEENSKNKQYQKPSLLYGLPAADSCGPVPVLRDVRTAAEKKQDEKQKQFMATNGVIIEPKQQKLTFQIVGISPDGFDGSEGFTLASLVKAIAGSNLGNAWIIPEEQLKQFSTLAEGMPPLLPTDHIDADFSTYIAEFTTAAQAEKFANTMKCPIANCEQPKREVSAMQYGSNSVIVAQLKGTVQQVLFVLGLAAVVIAAVVMMANVGRMIADGRRETAVFRAIGAKRIDIALIYAMYTFFVSLAIGSVAVVAGVAIAFYVDARFGQEVTAQALLSFGASDISRVFPLIFVHWYHVALVIGLALLAGFVGMLLPLVRNVRRNPINDMRDE